MGASGRFSLEQQCWQSCTSDKTNTPETDRPIDVVYANEWEIEEWAQGQPSFDGCSTTSVQKRDGKQPKRMHGSFFFNRQCHGKLEMRAFITESNEVFTINSEWLFKGRILNVLYQTQVSSTCPSDNGCSFSLSPLEAIISAITSE